MVTAEARHFQRIRDQPAGFQRQILKVAVHVVVGHQHGAVLVQQRSGAGLQRLACGRWQRGGYLGGVGTWAQAWAVQLAPLRSCRVKSYWVVLKRQPPR